MTTEEAIKIIESRDGHPHEDDWDLMNAAEQILKDYKAATFMGESSKEPRRKLPKKVANSKPRSTRAKASK